MKATLKVSAIIICSVLFTSCATIFGHSVYSVRINSSPASSFIVLDREGVEIHKGTTPQVVELKSSAGYFKRASYG